MDKPRSKHDQVLARGLRLGLPLNGDEPLGAGSSEAAILRVSFGNILGEHEPLSGWLTEIPESLNCARASLGREPPCMACRLLPLRRRKLLKPSDSEDDPAEWALLDKVALSIRRLDQREGLSHDWLDSAGLKQSDDGLPRFLPGRGRLSEQQEAFDRGALPDHIGDIDGRFAAC